MSSTTDNTTKEWREEISSATRRMLGMLRRMPIRLTSGSFWQVIGHLLLDNVTKESHDAEVFTGIGLFARPPAGVNAEAIVAFPSGSSNPVIVATRDEDTRRKVAVIGQNETMLFNSLACVLVDRNSKIHAKLIDGTTHELAFASELNDLRAFVKQQFAGAGHTHTVSGSVTTVVTPIITPVVLPATDYPGTTVLKAQ